MFVYAAVFLTLVPLFDLAPSCISFASSILISFVFNLIGRVVFPCVLYSSCKVASEQGLLSG